MFQGCFCFDRSNCLFFTLSLGDLKADDVTQKSHKWKVTLGQVYRLLLNIVKHFKTQVNKLTDAICAKTWNRNKWRKQQGRAGGAADGQALHVAFWKEPEAPRLVGLVAFSLSSLCQTLFALHGWHVGKKTALFVKLRLRHIFHNT